MASSGGKTLLIYMNIEGDTYCNPDELTLRNDFHKAIEDKGIGSVIGGGSGAGQMDISVEVDDVSIAKRLLKILASELKIRCKISEEEDDA